MIEVMFVLHARGKITADRGSLGELPEVGQLISIKGCDHKVLGIQTHKGVKHLLPLYRPLIDVEPHLDDRTDA